MLCYITVTHAWSFFLPPSVRFTRSAVYAHANNNTSSSIDVQAAANEEQVGAYLSLPTRGCVSQSIHP